MAIEVWDLWFPNAAAQGLSFARGRLDATEILLVHAPPGALRVEVRDDEGRPIAKGDQLRRSTSDYFPIARLTKDGGTISRVDGWPEDEDMGRPVILPGGEVGILKSWWNSTDGQEWRWQIEFYNHR
jgi:hypothetical protein